MPEKIGRYEVIRELGRGGMATVYLAYDPSFARQIAIKVLPRQFTHDPQFRARFEREAKVIASLEHPYVVPVYDYGEEDDQPYIVMRYMPGGTLAERIAGKRWSPKEIAPIIQRLAEALDEAHSQNIIHRDLKPSNVMFDAKGHVFLSDFGIAKMLEASTALTGSGVVGTPAYMSPEQATGNKTIGARSDVYALGVILYEMLTGHHPYQAETPMQVMLKLITEPVPRLNAEQLGLPVEWDQTLATALAKEPDERFSSAGALAEAVNALVTGSFALVSAPPTLPSVDTGSFIPTVPALPSDSTPTHPGAKLDTTTTRVPPRFSPRQLVWISVPVVILLAGLLVFAVWGASGLGKPTPTATLTPTTAAPTIIIVTATSPSPTVTLAATNTLLPPSLTPTPSATPTELPPTATTTSTRAPTRIRPSTTATPVPPTATAPPPDTPTLQPPPQDNNPPPGSPPTNTPAP